MSHRHRGFFSHVGIQRLTKEAVCFINGSALRGPPNKRVSVSKCSRGGCDLMIQKPLITLKGSLQCFHSVDVFVWETLCDAWLLWMNVQRSHDCRDTGIISNPSVAVLF